MAANAAHNAAQEFNLDCFEKKSINSSGLVTLNRGLPNALLTLVSSLLLKDNVEDRHQKKADARASKINNTSSMTIKFFILDRWAESRGQV